MLRRRYGNSFEMATLLCSMLIGAGFPAMVVSGSARFTTINNDQRDVEYPLPHDSEYTADPEVEEVVESSSTISEKYKLKEKPDLSSHLEEKLEAMRKEKEAAERKRLEQEIQTKRDIMQEQRLFDDPRRLSHAWVAVVDNAPWSIKPIRKIVNEEGEEVDEPPQVTFIEPSTGVVHQVDTKAYVHVESMWNNLNYYVNLQDCRIREMKWDFRDTSTWEHFLAAEPAEMRIAEDISDENLTEDIVKKMVEKHLDTTRSWVERLEIGEKEYDERYRNKYKAIYFKRVLLERYSTHSRPDGQVKQLTLFSDDKYEVPSIRWQWFDNRNDLLTKSRYTYGQGKTEECLQKGRSDCLKFFIYYDDDRKPKIMHFYSGPRLDALRYCEVHENKFILIYEKTPGKCFYQEFICTRNMTNLKEFLEMFVRDPEVPPIKDIKSRQFILKPKKIVVKFHYVRGALTATVIEFTKPPKPDYGQEITFLPELVKTYSFSANQPKPTALELYQLLLKQLKAEDVGRKFFYKKYEELLNVITTRVREKQNILLTFRCYDPLRNTAARELRVKKDEEEAQELRKRWSNLPDFLAPYLVPYSGRVLTAEESWNAYRMCLLDLKKRNVSLLNELQHRYEDLTDEQLSLKKFLNKFQNKFDDFDYERLVQESKDLELNKRMVQKRLTITHQEAQNKYDLVKRSLLHDTRLNLSKAHQVHIIEDIE